MNNLKSNKNNLANETELDNSSSIDNTCSNIKIKKKYVKPNIESEDLMVFGAVCNGTTTGGRKASAASPAFCNSTRLNS